MDFGCFQRVFFGIIEEVARQLYFVDSSDGQFIFAEDRAADFKARLLLLLRSLPYHTQTPALRRGEHFAFVTFVIPKEEPDLRGFIKTG